MWPSARLLLAGTGRHWLQLASGGLVGVLGLVSDARGWNLPRWIWASLALSFVGWAVLLAFHELRLQCDAALDGLRDRRDHQALADALTAKHAYAKSNFFKPGDFQIASEAWLEKVRAWHADVIGIMTTHGCTPQEMNHVKGIGRLEARQYSTKHPNMAILMVEMNRIAEISTHHARIAEQIGLASRNTRRSGDQEWGI